MSCMPMTQESEETEGAIGSAAKCRHASQRQRRVSASQDKSPQVSEGFVMCWLHYDSQLGPREAPHDLPDAAASFPKGARDLRLALMIRAADARHRPTAAGSPGSACMQSTVPRESREPAQPVG